jgi:hypothetical protein
MKDMGMGVENEGKRKNVSSKRLAVPYLYCL